LAIFTAQVLGVGFKPSCQEISEVCTRMQTDQPPLAKVLVAGASRAGKTSLVNRLVFHDFLDVSPTIGVNFAQKVCVGRMGPLNLSIWDLSGQERFRFIMPQLCGGAVGVVLVFDQTQPASLHAAGEWQDFVARYANPSHRSATVLVGAKVDLESTIADAAIESFCNDRNVTSYIRCSSKTGRNVKLVFDTLASAIQLSCPEAAGMARTETPERCPDTRSTPCETPPQDC
jgi:small GTP-binding protein